ncbi:hypothetical protein QAD02_021570 [Eretmocerus hayati]|uniref:Uncharacterized protein n=1 Tax=Eretmocerus hayati TaxID=131215 RepID=A0ACC2PQT7_9HYME|nr:hypothetical protein QAD02_021570 [Eretmocerus hayati]
MADINLEYEMLVLTLCLYNNLVVPRNVVQMFTKTLIDFSTKTFAEHILHVMKYSGQFNDEALKVMGDIFKNASNLLSKFDTERKRFEIYKEKNLLVEPIKFELYKSDKTAEVCHLPLGWTLKTFLEIPGAFELLMEYEKELKNETDIVFNFMQAEYWREKSGEFGNRIVIPLFFGHDDFTAGNGMESHAEKTNLGDVFAFLPGLPPHIVSKLSSIFLVDLFFANDRKEFGNSQVFSRLIDDLNDLNKNGVNICVEDRSITVFFKPCLEIGDNKGFNEDLGFDPHFNSGRPCRICRATIDEIRTMIQEVASLLRTRENYEADCFKKSPSETGVVEKCTFYQIEDWELTDLTCQDLMHDGFEGWANYTLTNICNDLIYRQSRFDLEYLNQRIIWLNSHTLHISNAIPLIKQSHLTAKHKLKMSAAEMINFSKYFGLLVGDKMGEDANENNQTWSLYILMRKIIDVLLSPRVVHGHMMKLRLLVPEFLSSYIALYGELQYKFHSLVHVIRMLKKFGPLIYYWAMRLESKQRELKVVATTSSSSVNLLYTIALRHQLKLAYLKLTGDMRMKDVEVETVEKIDVKARASYFSHIDAKSQISSTNGVQYKGITFKVGMLIVTDLDDPDSVKFGLIRNIFLVEQEVFLLVQPHTSIYFDDVRHAYNVQAREAYVIKDVKHIPYIHPCALFISNNSSYAVPKYIL